MKKRNWFLSLLASFVLATGATAFATDVVIYRIGTGTGSLLNTGNPVFVDDYGFDSVGNTATLLNSVGFPTTASGSSNQLVASGTATSEGFLTVSPNGQFITVTGYASNLPASGSLSGLAVPRTVGILNVGTGSVDTSTALTNYATGNNPRSAVFDGTNIWAVGGAGGVVTATPGSTGATATTVSTTNANLRQVNIFGGQLYVSSGSGTVVHLGTVGTGLPITGPQTTATLPDFPTAGSQYAYFFADLSAAVAGVDTLYVADDAAGITKYSLDSGTWVAKGTAGTGTDAYRGLTGVVNAADSSITLFSTRKGGSGATGGGELVDLVDTSGYDGTFAPASINLLATAGANEAFRGVGVVAAPIPVPEPSTLVLAGIGLAGLAIVRRRKQVAK